MRAIKTWRFNIKTKIPFSEWPTIVHAFLNECNLSYSRYMYYFEDYADSSEPTGEPSVRCGCRRILKDLPSLGEIRYHGYAKYLMSDSFWLSNIDCESSVSEADILPLMKKIHRSYGIPDCYLYYYDIDFLGCTIPFERDYSIAEKMCLVKGMDYDPTRLIEFQPYGSGIVLHRDVCGENYLDLSIDILHDGKENDPEPYFRKMRELLPNVRYTESMKIYMTDEEKQQIEEANRNAVPIIGKASDYFLRFVCSKEKQNTFSSSYSLAPKLKKLSKKYGYQYRKTNENYYFLIEKRTERGNVLQLCVYTGPSHYYLCFDLFFQGIGFRHSLCGSMQTPADQQEADECLEKMFKVLSEFEEDILPELDALFPPTPHWFVAED